MINGTGTEKILWSSSNSAVAVVDSNGTITAVSVGKATITAYCDGISATCIVNVISSTGAISFVFDSAQFGDIEYNANRIYNFSARIVNNLGKNFKTWSFELVVPSLQKFDMFTEATFTVDLETKVFSGENLLDEIAVYGTMEIGDGYNIQNYYPFEITNIKYTLDDGSEGEIEPPIEEPDEVLATDISLDVTNVELYVGNSKTIHASVAPSNYTNSIAWSSSDESIVTVNSTGIIKAINLGTATITAKIDNVSASCVVNVISAPTVESIVLSNSEINLFVGNEKTITATLNPEGVSEDIIWSSDNSNVATVNQNGTITAISEGVANITATCGNITATCKVNVSKIYLADKISINFENYNESSTWNDGRSGYLDITIENNSDEDVSAWTLVSSLPEGMVSNLGYVRMEVGGSLQSASVDIQGNVFSGQTLPAHSKIYISGTYELPAPYYLADFLGNIQVINFTYDK